MVESRRPCASKRARACGTQVLVAKNKKKKLRWWLRSTLDHIRTSRPDSAMGSVGVRCQRRRCFWCFFGVGVPATKAWSREYSGVAQLSSSVGMRVKLQANRDPKHVTQVYVSETG